MLYAAVRVSADSAFGEKDLYQSADCGAVWAAVLVEEALEAEGGSGWDYTVFYTAVYDVGLSLGD